MKHRSITAVKGRRPLHYSVDKVSGAILTNYWRALHRDEPWEVHFKVASFGGAFMESHERRFRTQADAMGFIRELRTQIRRSR